MEKQEWRVATILLILIVQVNAKSIHISKGYKPNSFGKSPLGRYLSERRHIIFNHRDTPTFTDVERTFQEEGLKAHNIYRARHCVLPLVLDDEINARAKAYALHLASNDSKLIHSTDRGGRLGENLYAVTRSNPITYPDGKTSPPHFILDNPSFSTCYFQLQKRHMHGMQKSPITIIVNQVIRKISLISHK